MKYKEYEEAFSPARLSRYKAACGGDTRKAMTLYRYYVKLYQKYCDTKGSGTSVSAGVWQEDQL